MSLRAYDFRLQMTDFHFQFQANFEKFPRFLNYLIAKRVLFTFLSAKTKRRRARFGGKLRNPQSTDCQSECSDFTITCITASLFVFNDHIGWQWQDQDLEGHIITYKSIEEPKSIQLNCSTSRIFSSKCHTIHKLNERR